MLVAEEQTAGRGRLDRRWSAPAALRALLLRLLKPGPTVPVERWGWLPLLAGVAAATGLARAAGVDTALKWPNDLLVTVDGEERKTGGILAERRPADGGGVVIGIGLNVSLRADELPVPARGLARARRARSPPTATRCCGPCCAPWSSGTATGATPTGDPAASRLQEAYAAGCATLGRTVRAELPGDRSIVGEAVAIDGDGRLVLATDDGVQEPVAAGDIVHLRAAERGHGAARLTPAPPADAPGGAATSVRAGRPAHVEPRRPGTMSQGTPAVSLEPVDTGPRQIGRAVRRERAGGGR